ncbi:unnamed protein product [Parnassius apollo]|uniref:(apollo) hypothetical protein n=1 Tax=Parnassius apollo TaxID=110799 RepID=A0A8S3W6X5_PARAO|nr:unnamed protein product [Parnassius apollo]
MDDDDQEYYSKPLHLYSILQKKQHQWSTNVSNFTEHTFDKDLKCSFGSNSRKGQLTPDIHKENISQAIL